ARREPEPATAHVLRAREIRREHVGSELHPPEIHADGTRVRIGEQGLGHARHALEQHVAPNRGGRDQYLDHVILADHDLADLGEHTVPQFVQPIPPSSPATRASARPSASASSSFVTGVSSAPTSWSVQPSAFAACEISPSVASMGRAARAVSPSRVHACLGDSARARSRVRSNVCDNARTYSDLAGGRSRVARSGGPNRRARDHTNASAPRPIMTIAYFQRVGIALMPRDAPKPCTPSAKATRCPGPESASANAALSAVLRYAFWSGVGSARNSISPRPTRSLVTSVLTLSPTTGVPL